MLLIILKRKKFVSMQLKNYIVLRYVPDQDKTQQMCDKAILENGGILMSVPDATKIKKFVIKQLIITLMH